MTAPPRPLESRGLLPEDLPYVYSTWTRSYIGKGRESLKPVRDPETGKQKLNLHGFAMWDRAPDRIDHEDLARRVRALVARSTITVWHLAGHPHAIVAWAAFEGDRLHYLVVKMGFREAGFGTWLISQWADRPITYTHWTSDWSNLRLPEHWRYRPFGSWPEES